MSIAKPISGIYKMYWLNNDNYYFGQSCHIVKRQNDHLHRFKKGTHANRRLQKIFDKYGAPVYETIELGPADQLNSLEQHYIDLHFGKAKCCNILPIAGTTKGLVRTAEHTRKISESNKGRTVSAYHRQRVSESNKSRVVTQQHKDRIAAAHKGRKWPPEFGAKISQSKMGHTVSEETRRKLREANLGKTYPNRNGLTDEVKSKLKGRLQPHLEKKVIDTSTGIEYRSMLVAAEALRMTYDSVRSVLTGRRKERNHTTLILSKC